MQTIMLSGTGNKAPQTITFNNPGTQTVGGMLPLSATGGGSGQPVTFSSLTLSVCTVSGSTASMIAAGMCTTEANQAGNTN